MLALLAILTILCVLAAILLDLASPVVALVAVPVLAAVLGGFGLETSRFVIAGVTSLAPIIAMFIFSILYFGVMTDAGLLKPLVNSLVRSVGNRPSRIVLASAALALLVHLDGSGAVCFIVVIPTFLPLYDAFHMDRRVLACVSSLAAGVNFLPWTGPTLRASAALHIPVMEILRPLLPVQLIGLVFVFGVAAWLGRREDKRVAATLAKGALQRPMSAPQSEKLEQVANPNPSLTRWALNAVLTLVVLGTMIAGRVDPAVAFMVGTVIALIVNFPRSSDQRSRIEAHARAAILMASTLIAAGAFTGIMTGSGMLKALAHAAVAYLPAGAGNHLPVILGLIAMPLSLLFDPDSYYFGVMPVLAEVTRSVGGLPINIAQASLLGMMTTGFPISPLTPATFLVTGLSGVDLAAHQKFSGPLLFAASISMCISAVLLGILPL